MRLLISGETLFVAVAETVFERYQRIWKVRTLEVNRGYLRNQILPCFSGRPIADIDSREVRNWFASLRATPVAADRSMPVLSVIMREAEAMGLRPEGLQPLPGHPALSPEREGALPVRRRAPAPVLSTVCPCRTKAAANRSHPSSPPNGLPQERDPDAALVRLPGRPSLPARQQDRVPEPSGYPARHGRSSTGSSEPAGGSSRRPGPEGRRVEVGWPLSGLRSAPRRSLNDVRLHDLRHTHASIALRKGETVLAIGRLLGHRNAETTLKYTHPADAMVVDAAETVGAILER